MDARRVLISTCILIFAVGPAHAGEQATQTECLNALTGSRAKSGSMVCSVCATSSSGRLQYQQKRCVDGKWLDVAFCSLDASECQKSLLPKKLRRKS